MVPSQLERRGWWVRQREGEVTGGLCLVFGTIKWGSESGSGVNLLESWGGGLPFRLFG